MILYTVTSDATLRIFQPVLDTPQYLQLHAALDFFSAASPDSLSKGPHSSVFWLHKDTIADSFSAILSGDESHNQLSPEEISRYRRLKEMNDEGWDSFARVLEDGSLVVRAVAVSTSLEYPSNRH